MAERCFGQPWRGLPRQGLCRRSYQAQQHAGLSYLILTRLQLLEKNFIAAHDERQ